MKARLTRLGYGQKDLARAAEVTEPYISQLLGERKPPPGQDRTAIYSKMEAFLELPPGELVRLAEIERAEERRRRLGRAPEPMFRQFRELSLEKCVPEIREGVRAIFDAHPFGTLERLVARKLLEVAQGVARQELDNDDWIRRAARMGGRSHDATRALVRELLDADVFHGIRESCLGVLDTLVTSWSVDLDTLRIDIALEPALAAEPRRAFVFVAGDGSDLPVEEPGLAGFLEDPQINDDATEDEVRLLRHHRFGGRRPNKLYFYRALQDLRDPLHFSETV